MVVTELVRSATVFVSEQGRSGLKVDIRVDFNPGDIEDLNKLYTRSLKGRFFQDFSKNKMRVKHKGGYGQHKEGLLSGRYATKTRSSNPSHGRPWSTHQTDRELRRTDVNRVLARVRALLTFKAENESSTWACTLRLFEAERSSQARSGRTWLTLR